MTSKKLSPPPQLGTLVIAQNIDGATFIGYVSGFMGDVDKGKYCVKITFHEGKQGYRFYSVGEEGKLWRKLPS
jgi:hypothetical protein